MDFLLYRGEQCAGIWPPTQHPAGLGWLPYVLVSDLDGTVKRAADLGAKIVMAKCEIPGHGAFAMIVDPQGAIFNVWQNASGFNAGGDKSKEKDQSANTADNSKKTSTVAAANDESQSTKRTAATDSKPELAKAFCWHNLITPDIKASKEFYAALLDWVPVTTDVAGTGWWLDKTNQKALAPHAGMAKSDVSKSAKWISYLTVADVDAAVKLVSQLGGSIQKAAADMGQYGRVCELTDNLGSSVAIFTPKAPTLTAAEEPAKQAS